MGNKSLARAKNAEQDEYYTQLKDISDECKHYKEHFRDAVIFCNCDDPYESNFFKYFALNFNYFGLKKLVCTCYRGSPFIATQLSWIPEYEASKELNMHVNKKAYKIEINEVTDVNEDGAIDLFDVEWLLKNGRNVLTELEGDGSFDSPECLNLLQQSDICITNPPFSRLEDFIKMLVRSGKKFLILSNKNVLHYVDIFPLIAENKLWVGYNNGAKEYLVPDHYERDNIYVGEDGKKYAKMGNTGWLTNLDIRKRHETIDLYKKYTPDEYPKYLNFDAIEVNQVAEIPRDYYGNMGVYSDSFLTVYNPDQFEIIGLAEGELGKSIGMSANLSEEECKALFHEYKSFRRGNPIYRDKSGQLKKPFARIIIRRKDQPHDED